MLAGATPVASLEIDVQNLRSAKGLIRVCLTADPGNFPDCKSDARSLTRSVPAGQHLVRFEGLAPGDWAAAIIHDENGNGKLDTMMGIPREGFGFTRNPAIAFGPPRFKAASFAMGADPEIQPVRMRYMF